MDFEKVTTTMTKRSSGLNEVRDVCNRFLESDCEVAILKDWESKYASAKYLYMALYRLINLEYAGKLEVIRRQDNVYLRRA